MAAARLSDDQHGLYERAINTMAFADICNFVISLWPASVPGDGRTIVDLEGRKYFIPAADEIQDRIGLVIDDLEYGVLFSSLHWNIWIVVHRALLGLREVQVSLLDRDILQTMFVSSLRRRLADAEQPDAAVDALEDQKVIRAYFELNRTVAEDRRP